MSGANHTEAINDTLPHNFSRKLELSGIQRLSYVIFLQLAFFGVVKEAEATANTTAAATTTAAVTTTEIPRCPDSGMNHAARRAFLNTHNRLRSRLAKGEEFNGNFGMAPQAANMQKMQYDCFAESTAMAHARTCSGKLSNPDTRPGLKENFIEIYKTYMTLPQTARHASQRWWKELSMYGVNPNIWRGTITSDLDAELPDVPSFPSSSVTMDLAGTSSVKTFTQLVLHAVCVPVELPATTPQCFAIHLNHKAVFDPSRKKFTRQNPMNFSTQSVLDEKICVLFLMLPTMRIEELKRAVKQACNKIKEEQALWTSS
ncbi:SCP-like protein [Ancylostoma ceylanicum]|uniref:SCP-like protein n=1 Tax=Ancylostoma ceylanicum TaxID=53326 RepID=A0A0D6M522_9BILA|nr:SCP-like protein [Ancylostoma ceylanicum]